MTDILQAKFAQMVKDAKCPEAFKDWLIKQQLLTFEMYGRVAASEDKLDTKVDAILSSEGGKFKNIGESTCIVKLWAACRDALAISPTGAPVQGTASLLDQGLSEGTEHI